MDTIQERYTDAEILEEARTVLQDKRLRRCKMCSHYKPIDEKTGKCDCTGGIFTSFMYAGNCRFYETNEEKLIRDARERMAALAKEERKLNHLLTASLDFVEAALLILEDFESRVEKEFKKADATGTGDKRVRRNDREWMAKLKTSYKNMCNLIDGARRQYTHYVEPNLNKVFFDKEKLEYDVEEYDNHMSDAHELTRLGLLFFEKAFMSEENSQAVFALLNSQKGCGVLDESDFYRYNLRR